MKRTSSHGVAIAYEDHGPALGPTLLCLPGWCSNRTLFAPFIKAMAGRRRVLALDWRAHGDSERPSRDFGLPDLVEDALAVVAASGAERVVPVAVSHAGWMAIEMQRRLAGRVPALVLMDWLVLDPPPPFLDALQALQDPNRWQQTRDQLFALWLAGAPAHVEDQIRREMGAYGFEMWSRAGREIAAAYARHGSPLRSLVSLPPTPVLHVYAQPPDPGYLAAQEDLSRRHRWFTVRRLAASSHFPVLEVPEATAVVVEAFLDEKRGAGEPS
jgi:pimeloyl-ACP methyl ester carboxylesterase